MDHTEGENGPGVRSKGMNHQIYTPVENGVPLSQYVGEKKFLYKIPPEIFPEESVTKQTIVEVESGLHDEFPQPISKTRFHGYYGFSSQEFQVLIKVHTHQPISWGKSFQNEYLALNNISSECHPLDLLPQRNTVGNLTSAKKIGKGGRSSISKKSRHAGKHSSIFRVKKQKRWSIKGFGDRPLTDRHCFTEEVTSKKDRSVLVTSEGSKALELLQRHFQQQGCCWKHVLSKAMPGLPSFHPNATCSRPDASSTLRSHSQNQPFTETNESGGLVSKQTVAPELQPKDRIPPCKDSCQVGNPQREASQPSETTHICKLTTPLLHAQDYRQIILIAKISQAMSTLEHIQQCFVIGLAYYKLVEHYEAKFHLTQGEELAFSANRDGDVALCNVYLGDIEFSAGKFLNAVRCYQKAIAHCSPDCVASMFRMVPPSLSIIHAKCGSAFRSASKSVEAVQEYKAAIRVALSDRDRLAAHTSLGNLYQSLGENNLALKEYEESIKLAEYFKDHISLGWAHGNMGNALLGLHRKDEALFHLQKALDIAVEHEPTPQAIGRTYNNLGTAYQSMNEFDKAEEYYDLALSQAIYGSDTAGQARVYGNIGNVLMLRKDYERAIRHFSEVLQLTKDASTLSTARHNRGCAYYEWAERQMASLSHDNPQKSTMITPRLKKTASDCRSVVTPEVQAKDNDLVAASATLTDTTPGNFCIHSPRNTKTGNEYSPPTVPSSSSECYMKGSEDLEEVVKHHEETLENLKGSSKGLSLSVSLFESNSRSFHRLQDCLVRQGKYDRALLSAEQSRARTLGELMLSKFKWQFEKTLSSPLNLDQISMIVESQNCPVVYLSYTGARILGWVFVPHSGEVSMSMFEVPLEDDMFDGKSFDYHVRYNLTEKLVEKSFEMYQSVKYDKESSAPVQELHTLLAKPLLHILKKNCEQYSSPILKKIVVIPDSYTSLVPFTCLLDPESGDFLGDQYYFQMMPSLLSMGILSQMPDVTVTLPAKPHTFCVVGDPNIPPFHYNGEIWHLGKLPYAKREAEWVAHVLKTSPVLEEQATKSTVLMRITNAKVIHIATHGSASSGFLAFGTVAPHRPKADNKGMDAAGILLYPEEVEKLSISPALVVLSSCDSGRGTVKADGIQGMARAFILAGAQSVLTTLWRVPDESASVFMKFFYQYLMDGLKSSMALHKAILSIRCFSKYSQYIHWSGYQLTGRDIQFDVILTPATQILEDRLGAKSVFPRLEMVKKLETALVNNTCIPTDVQIVKGGPGLRPSEIVKDFIHSSHEHFSEGVFWINCRQPDLIHASIAYIEEGIGTDIDQLSISENQQALFVFDAITELPRSEKLLKVMKNRHVHIVFTFKSYEPPDMLIKEVDRKLIRGCAIHNIEPLSIIESTQRIVHSVMKDHHLAPNNEDQQLFEKLAQFTSGSPVIVEVASKSLLAYFKKYQEDEKEVLSQFSYFFSPHLGAHEMLSCFSNAISLDLDRKSRLKTPQLACKVNTRSPPFVRKTRSISKHVQEEISAISAISSTSEDRLDVWDTNSQYDSWDSIEELINICQLSPEERLLLNTLCMFSCSPIPYSLVIEVSSLIAMATQQPHKAGTLSSKLLEMCLMKKYPSPVVLHPSLTTEEHDPEPEFVYVPQYISRSIWKNLEECDRVIALSTMFQALLVLFKIAQPLEACFLVGLCGLLLEMHEFDFPLMGEECYKTVHQLYEQYRERIVTSHLKDSYKPHSREQNNGNLSYVPVLMLDSCSTKIVTPPISRPKADLYPLKSKEHGVAVIISNKTFDKHPERPGTYRNEENFVETFRFLGYRVEVRHQCTKAHILKLYDKIDSLIKDTDDSFVCCLLSHGGENFIYGADSKEVLLRMEKDSLETKLTKCRKLDGKPKMFFVPSIRKPMRPRCQPDGDGDFAFYYLPLTENDSTRHHDTGALYVDTLCRVLCQTAPSKTLSDIHETVSKEVKGGETDSQQSSSKSEKQMTKEVFFFDDL